MSNSTLVAHCGAHKVSYAELKTLPDPVAMGSKHKPIPHVEVVDGLQHALVSLNKMEIRKAEYAVQGDGSKLFGVLDLVASGPNADRGYSVGFRSSHDQSFAFRIVAGTRVFVCDNLALSGNDIVMNRKQTTGFQVKQDVRDAVDRLLNQYASMDLAIARMQEHELYNQKAKELIYDAFVNNTVDIPVRLLSHVNDWYFNMGEHPDATDCSPRSLWGLHNSFTRAIKELNSPVRQFEVTQSVGCYLGLLS